MTAPPPKPIKPGEVKVLRALYNYEAQGDDELSFEEGDLLFIYDMLSSADWWKARANGKEGLIPSNYVSNNLESIGTPLHEAAKRNNVTFMTECLANGVSANGLDHAGCTPMHWAARNGSIDCLKILLNKKARLDIRNKLGETPLHSAASKDQLECIKLLLANGANPSIENKDKELPYKLTLNTECAALLKPRDFRKSTNDEMYIDDDDEEEAN